MKLLTIALKDVRIRVKDRKAMIMMLLFPILLTAILGMALDGVINGNSSSMPKMTIAVYNGDSGELGKHLMEDVLQAKELKTYVTVQTVSSDGEALQSVQEGNADAGIVIPDGYSQRIFSGDPGQIEVLQDPGKQTIGQIVLSIVTSYSNRVSSVASSTKEVMTELGETAVFFQSSPPNFQKMASDLVNELQQTAAAPHFSVSEQSSGNKTVSGLQYYAAGMATMFLLFNAMIGAKSILQERSTQTLSRLFSTPTSKTSILTGKFLGTLFFSILQFGVFMGVTYLVFGMNWGDNVVQSIVIGLAFSIAVSGLSMAVAAFAASEQAVDVVMGIGIQILALLGGSMLPLSMFPDLLRKIAFVAPNTWALNSFLEIMAGTTWQTLLLPIVVLLAIGAASLTIGILRLRAQ